MAHVHCIFLFMIITTIVTDLLCVFDCCYFFSLRKPMRASCGYRWCQHNPQITAGKVAVLGFCTSCYPFRWWDSMKTPTEIFPSSHYIPPN